MIGLDEAECLWDEIEDDSLVDLFVGRFMFGIEVGDSHTGVVGCEEVEDLLGMLGASEENRGDNRGAGGGDVARARNLDKNIGETGVFFWWVGRDVERITAVGWLGLVELGADRGAVIEGKIGAEEKFLAISVEKDRAI